MLYISEKALVFPVIRNGCVSSEEKIFKEESVEVLKTFDFIDNMNK